MKRLIQAVVLSAALCGCESRGTDDWEAVSRVYARSDAERLEMAEHDRMVWVGIAAVAIFLGALCFWKRG